MVPTGTKMKLRMMEISKKYLRKARILAMQVIYSYEKNAGDIAIEVVFESIASIPEAEIASNDAVKFAKGIILSYRSKGDEIDALLSKNMKNWVLERVDSIDRAILRTALAELLSKDTPLRVVISESVDIAKQFGTDDSGKFVNGVLDGTKKDIDYVD